MTAPGPAAGDEHRFDPASAERPPGVLPVPLGPRCVCGAPWAEDCCRRDDEHYLDMASVINPADDRPYPLWAGSEPVDPDPRCICGAPWYDGGCRADQERPDLYAEVTVGLLRRGPGEWVEFLTPLKMRAVDENRLDVVEYIESILSRLAAMAPPATADGSVRSPCLPVAKGEAWTARAGAPIPDRFDSPLPSDVFQYAGAVGYTAPDPPPDTGDPSYDMVAALRRRDSLPAIELLPGEPHDVAPWRAEPVYLAPSIQRGNVWWHDLHLLDALRHNREFLLVVDIKDAGERVIVHRAQVVSADAMGNPGECGLLHTELYLLLDPARGCTVTILLDPARPVPALPPPA
jgi:hypothetical protein